MVNPGVIKLLSGEDINKIGLNFRLEVEDNVGESIHIHYRNIRLDYSIDQFYKLLEEISNITEKIVHCEGFHGKEYDPQFLMETAGSLPYLLRVEEEEIFLKDIMVDTKDDRGNVVIKALPESRVYKALLGNTKEDDERIQINRFSSSLERMSNRERTYRILDQIRTKGYNDSRKIVVSDSNRILDGQHRAAALLYLYGNKKIKVKKFYYGSVVSGFVHNKSDEDLENDELNRLKEFCSKFEKIYLYGAGNFGKRYLYLLYYLNIHVDGFITTFPEKNIFCGLPVFDAASFNACYKEKEYGILMAFNSEQLDQIKSISEWKKAEFYKPNHYLMNKIANNLFQNKRGK